MGQRLYFIDGLRGLFSLVVLLFHVFFVFFEHQMPSYKNFGLFFDGSAAVNIFFVLSGFSLSIGYLQALESGRENPELVIRRMALARYIRLAIPCLCACLIMYAVMAGGLNYFAKIPDDDKIQWWAWAYREQNVSLSQALRFSLYDIFLPAPFVPVAPYNGPYLITNLWTMTLELIGSFIVFIYLIAVKQSGLRIFLSVALTFALALAHSYFAFFFAGIIVADLFIRYKDIHAPQWLNVVVCFVVALTFALWRPEQSYVQVWLSMMLVLLISLTVLMRDFFGSAPFRYLGRISFALYLIHMPVIVSVQSYLYLTYRNDFPAVGMIAIAGGVTIIVSMMAAHLFSYIDGFAIRASHRFAKFITS